MKDAALEGAQQPVGPAHTCGIEVPKGAGLNSDLTTEVSERFK
jgi:hypothetical protein